MKLYWNRSTDPAWNLALEEAALTGMEEEIILLWRNSKAVIVGCNQNTLEEIDLDFVRQNGIAVIRRQSGGGAVFHDLGNVNFTVIRQREEDDFSNYGRFTAPVRDYLRGLGVQAELRGRNDLVVGGRKISGNAQAVRGGRIMHHGTLLYSADVSALAGALRPGKAKIESKGIASVRSRVANIADFLENPPEPEAFLEGLYRHFLEHTEDISEYRLAPEKKAAADRLAAEKYRSWEWNFGSSPPYDYEREIRHPFGLVRLRLAVKDGVMEGVSLSGDFFGEADKGELEQRLAGLPHQPEAIAAVLAGIPLDRYVHGMGREELLALFGWTGSLDNGENHGV